MRQLQRTFLCAFFVASAVFPAACGGKETMASKSAAAYREAQTKGTPVSGGHEHGGHAVEGTTDHSTMTDMPGTDHATMAGMDHATKDGIDHSQMAGMEHSKMTTAGHSDMTGMDHSTAQPDSMPGMNHSAMPGMQHGSASAPVAVVTATPRSSAEMARIEPGAALRPDAFDAPAPAAIAEAAKAARGGGHAGHSMSGMAQPAPTEPADHQHHPMAAPSSSTAAPTGNQTAVVYTCPMHPEVRSTTPGQCPKCGMTLVPATAQKEK